MMVREETVLKQKAMRHLLSPETKAADGSLFPQSTTNLERVNSKSQLSNEDKLSQGNNTNKDRYLVRKISKVSIVSTQRMINNNRVTST